jgi:hypothetical protein
MRAPSNSSENTAPAANPVTTPVAIPALCV